MLSAIQDALSGLVASATFERAYLAALTKAKGRLRALVSDLGMMGPDRLRTTFVRAFGPLVLTPSPEGYRVTGKIKAPEIRAGSGGLSPSNASCGGVSIGFSESFVART